MQEHKRLTDKEFLCSKISANILTPPISLKKIDKLTEYAKNHGTFYMGNKLCTGIEKYSSAFIACEGEVSIALDKAMAAKLIPSIIIAIGKNENADIKELSETLDTIFGEENTMACRNAISTSGGNN